TCPTPHPRGRAGDPASVGGWGPLWVWGGRAAPAPPPTVKKTFTTAGFAEVCGLNALRELTSRPGVELDTAFVLADPVRVDLDEPQDSVAVQHALFFPEEDERSPVVFFLLSRVVPTLRHIGWLPKPVLRMPVRS
ncbi:hypothetical protein ACFXPP_05670, partial [Streptomyces sp. NPDC059134]